jgi:acetolactate synthase-1/2/3 large subunit
MTQLLFTEPLDVPHALCEVLIDGGVDVVLGVPGGDVVAVFDALHDYQDRIRVGLVRDEALAGVMAEAYGRTLRRPCVLLAQGIWVLAHAAMGALEALTGSSPMVILAEVSDKIPFSQQNPTQSGTGDPGNWNAALAFRGFTKHVLEAHDPVQALAQIQLALRLSMAGTPGPVAVLLYRASLRGTVGPDSRPPIYARGPAEPVVQSAEVAAVAAAGALLSSAARPVIIAGNGVRLSGAYAQLESFASSAGIPVVTTSSGKGVFPEDHPLAGGVMGEFGLDAANHLVGAADVVLAIGTRLAPGDTVRAHPDLMDPTRQTLIQLDAVAERIGWSIPADLGLVGDAATVLTQLAGAADAVAGAGDGEARVRAAFAAHGSFEVAASSSDEVPILPQRVIAELARLLPADAVVTADAGENRIFLVHHYRTRSAGGFLQPGSTGGMGYAVPAALGVKLANPAVAVVAVAGDGGFGMSLAGLLTARELDLPIVIVVLNNAMLGWVQHVQGDRRIATDLGVYDYAAIARATGCGGSRVEQPAELAPALAEALQSGRPWVIEVVTSSVPSWRSVSSSLTGAAS